MSKVTDAMKQFYLYVKDECVISEELKNILISDEVKIEFFTLCEKFADISLNAPKFKDKVSGEIGGCFQFSDIENAKNAARVFYLKYQLNDIDSYMETIHKVYHLAVDCNDDRAKSGFVQSEIYNYDHGFMGKYYNFQELPEDIWITICAETKEYIQSKLDEIEL